MFSEGQQSEEGCWNNDNIRDTAFTIYSAGWRSRSSGGESDGNSGGLPGGLPGVNNSNNNTNDSESFNPTFQDDCELQGYYCGDRFACLDSSGSLFPNYQCLSFAEVCCSVQPAQLETCSSFGGEVCGVEERCSTTEVQASDGACCADGVCRAIQNNVENNQSGGGTNTPTTSGGSNLWLWIIILVILIGIVVLGFLAVAPVSYGLGFDPAGWYHNTILRPLLFLPS